MITYVLFAIIFLLILSIFYYVILYPLLILIECLRSNRSILSRVLWAVLMVFIWPFTQYFYVLVTKGPIGRRFQAFMFLCIVILSTVFLTFVAPRVLEDQSSALNQALRKFDRMQIPGSSAGGTNILSDALRDLQGDFKKYSSDLRGLFD